MAGVITHIYVAGLLIENGLVNVVNKSKYYLGTIAPDAIMSNSNYQREDKKYTHLRENISSDEWYHEEYKKLYRNRIELFYIENVK